MTPSGRAFSSPKEPPEGTQPAPVQLQAPQDEPVRGPLDTSDFEFERRKINIRALREAFGAFWRKAIVLTCELGVRL